MNFNDMSRFRKGYELLCQVSGQIFGTDPVECAQFIQRAVMQLSNRGLVYENMMCAQAFDYGVITGLLLESDPPRLADAQAYTAMQVVMFEREIADKPTDEKRVIAPEKKLVTLH